MTTPSVAGDLTPPLVHEQTAKAKHRLETICSLLSAEQSFTKGPDERKGR